MLNVAMLERVARAADAHGRREQPGPAVALTPKPARDRFTRSGAPAPDPLLANAMRGLAARLGSVEAAAGSLKRQLAQASDPGTRRGLALAVAPQALDLERLVAIRDAVRGRVAGRKLTADDAARTARLAQEAARSLDGRMLPRIETRLRLLAVGTPPQRDLLAGIDQLDTRLGRLGMQLRRLARQAQGTSSPRELGRLETEHAGLLAQISRLGEARESLITLALRRDLTRPQLGAAIGIARELPHREPGPAQDQALQRLSALRSEVG